MKTQTVFMVRPRAFGFNPETAPSNAFQFSGGMKDAAHLARAEFDAVVSTLNQAGIQTLVWEEPPGLQRPDSVFPNNWFSSHPKGKLFLYPMLSPLRQQEVDPTIIHFLQEHYGPLAIHDWRQNTSRFLEGRGSLVFDHRLKRAYLARSPRSDGSLAQKVCAELQYKLIAFSAQDQKGQAIYHTNVLLSIGTDWALVCADAVAPSDRERILSHLSEKRELHFIDHSQMNRFAANILELDQRVLALSETAREALGSEGAAFFKKQNLQLVSAAIPTIEKLGGGSLRCMLAELFW